jgi:hypothetical protein
LSYSETMPQGAASETANKVGLGELLIRLAVELKQMAQQTSNAESLVSQLVCESTIVSPDMMKNLQGLDLLRQLQEDASTLLNQIATSLSASLAIDEEGLQSGLRLNEFVQRVVRGVDHEMQDCCNSELFFDDFVDESKVGLSVT